MKLYNLDTKITDRSYELLNNHIEEQRELDSIRVGEIRTKCRSILEKNGIGSVSGRPAPPGRSSPAQALSSPRRCSAADP